MSTVGIIGGLGPASTVDYYRGITDGYRAIHGNDSYPELLVLSVNMREVVGLVCEERYDTLAHKLAGYAARLQAAGADCVAIASNTPHIVLERLRALSPLPVLSILDAVCDEITRRGYQRVLILATEWTMRNGLFARAFGARGIGFVTPSDADITALGRLIYPNLENGIVIPADKQRMREIAQSYIDRAGCDAVLLGCTEIPLMLCDGDVSAPLVNSTQLHIQQILAQIDKTEGIVC